MSASDPSLPRPAGFLSAAVTFVARQLWAGLFAVIILGAIIGTKLIWQPGWALERYDALFLIAIGTQIVLLATRLETWDEAKVILLFHFTGTAMEWFKVNHGSWGYPEAGIFKILHVPLFTGFMYASVGSYIARSIRIFDAVFAPYPPYWVSVLLAVAIYVNFFAHHYLPDIRVLLFIATVVIFARTRLWWRVGQRRIWMPFPLAALGIGFALWVAENIGTLSGTWAYAGQGRWQLVSTSKIGAWYLLFFVSFATVTLVMRDTLRRGPWRPGQD
ncbi:DUF817 domain-containing protein [Pseudooceanicola sp. CBS1P-1]|uniref:DUF817 family protein n=1 Tax=Pseudooceanicola albus TaxID=2692189 RepID=A0A6L7G879_9RHOB|nr:MULTISPECIES: DUF817 domain-containing protein [Pseudooceanicola]MBT9382937.1 DUF817 domain-containing protein [Pseudooceanicola endophyticus]MXN20139.1 DUF817 family protein [Pseudooceanicola albus]